MDATVLLWSNPPSSCVNHKRLWALSSNALSHKRKLLQHALKLIVSPHSLIPLASLLVLQTSSSSSSSSTPVRSPYVEPRQRYCGRHQPSDTHTWDTSQRCPSFCHHHRSCHCHRSYKHRRHSTIDSTCPDCQKQHHSDQGTN